jgi:hypothetical protein
MVKQLKLFWKMTLEPDDDETIKYMKEHTEPYGMIDYKIITYVSSFELSFTENNGFYGIGPDGPYEDLLLRSNIMLTGKEIRENK